MGDAGFVKKTRIIAVSSTAALAAGAAQAVNPTIRHKNK
jgi:hypothetical protein